MNYLSECEIILVDGTFKSCPKMFNRLLIIHGVKNHNYTPLVFFKRVSMGKTQKIYQCAFSNLLLKMNNLKLNFSPKMIYADFEQAIHSAISIISLIH